EDLNQAVTGQCIMGTVAPFTQRKTVRAAKFYNVFNEPILKSTDVKKLPEDSYRNDQGIAYTKDESRYVRVIGRYQGTSANGEAIDRYLVIKEKLQKFIDNDPRDSARNALYNPAVNRYDMVSHWDQEQSSQITYSKTKGWSASCASSGQCYEMGWFDADDIDLIQVEFLPLSSVNGKKPVSGFGCPNFSY
ncbi:MAG: hypothetical protein AAF203_02150, partial [Pseudomonadota bacterium]